MRVNRFLFAGLLLGGVASADPPDASLKLDAAFKDKLTLLTDGKKHYVAVQPESNTEHRLFYGDGKKLYSVPVVSYSVQGPQFTIQIPDPRFVTDGRWDTELALAGGKYILNCGERKIELQPVDTRVARPLLDAATFAPSPRRWRSHALARDNRGIYYYVDRGRIRGTERQFRLFVGPKGNLVQQKMTNVVSDSQGDIFSTKSGDLRLILDSGPEAQAKDGVWIRNEKPTKLTIVPVEANIMMIYNELGVYAGERLGMPCDDL